MPIFPKKDRLFCERFLKKPSAIYWLVALVSVLVGIFVMIFMGIYPFGDRSILTVDLYHQYTPFLMELRRKLLNGENLFMSLSVGLGINFWTVMAYYGFSPFNLLLLLFPAWLIPFAIWLIILLKIILAAVTMTVFLNYYYVKRDGLAFSKLAHINIAVTSYIEQVKLLTNKKAILYRRYFSLILVASFYSWSGYIMAYLWNLMWLDAIYILPIVALGVSKLMRERKLLTYLLSLTYAICVNYYTAIFICLFTALYSLVLFLDEAQYRYSLRRKIKLLLESTDSETTEKEIFQQAKFTALPLALMDFTILSLLAALLAAPVLYPVWANFKLSSAAHDLWPSAVKWSFSFNEILNRLLAYGEVKVRSGEPNIYVGCFTLCLIALLLYRLYKRPLTLLPKVVLLIFIGLSFSNNYLNFIWHGMHYPNQLPHRFAFVFCFLLLQIVFELIWRFQWSWSRYLLIGAVWLLAICSANLSLLSHNTQQAKLYLGLNLLLALFYVLIAAIFTYSSLDHEKHQLSQRKQHLFRKSAVYLLVAISLIELCTNALVQMVNLNNSEYLPLFSNYVSEINEKQQLSAALNKLEKGKLWRMESTNGKTIDDGALYAYNGISLFSSTSNEKTAKAMRRLGINGNNLNSYKVQKPLNFFSDLFALKYFLTDEKEYQDWQKLAFTNIPGAERLSLQNLKWQLWQNLHVGKQAYIWPLKMHNFKLQARNPYLNYNELAAQLLGHNTLSAEFSLPSAKSLPSLYNPLVSFVENRNLLNISSGNSEYELRALQNKQAANPTDKSFVELSYIASEADEDISLYVDSSNTLNYTASVNGTVLQKHEFGQMEIVQLPRLNKADKLKLRFEFKDNKGYAKLSLAKLNKTVRTQLNEKLKQGFDWQVVSTRHLKARLDSLENSAFQDKLATNKYLYTTIPFDLGWRLFVDGKEMERLSWLDISEQKEGEAGAFLAFRLPEQLNTDSQLDLVFLPDKYLAALAIFAFAAIISSAYIYLLYRRRKGKAYVN